MTDLQPQWLKQQLAAVDTAGQVKSRKDAHFETGEHMLQLLAASGSPLGKACFMSWDAITLASSNSAPAIALSWRGFAHVNLQSCTCMCQATGIDRPPRAMSKCGLMNDTCPHCAHCGQQPVLSESRKREGDASHWRIRCNIWMIPQATKMIVTRDTDTRRSSVAGESAGDT